MTAKRDGFVLICVLWILVALTIITVSFGRKAVLERRAAAYTLDHGQALNMARGAVQRGIAEVRNKAVMDLARHPKSQEQYTGFDQHWHNHATLEEEGLLKVQEPGSRETVTYTIRDESSRISLNRAPEEILNKIEGLGVRGAAQILAMRGLTVGAKAKEPFQMPEQALDLAGVDNDAWTGEGDKPGLRDLLTCWGDGKLNINTASREVLEQIPDLAPDVLDTILTIRDGPDGRPDTNDDLAFTSIGDVREKTRLGMDVLAPVAKYCAFDSQFFTITGLATQRQGRIRAVCEAVVEVQNGIARIRQWREDPSGS